MTRIKISGHLYPATITGKTSDREWDGRESKSITLEGDYATVSELFSDGMSWSIVETSAVPVFTDEGEAALDESGQQLIKDVTEEYDNSDYSVLGDITVHQNGTCTVKMGKETDTEMLLVLLYGGE